MIKTLKSALIPIWVFLIFLVLFINMLNEDRNQKLLNHSKTVRGIMKFQDHASLKYTFGIFIFYVNHKKYEIRSVGDFSFLKPGDTVLIKYAINKPSVAIISDRYYMRKYKKL